MREGIVLATGTGGGRGAAYAGFLNALIERDIPARAICACGTSVLPALLFARGSDLLLATRAWSHFYSSGLVRRPEALEAAIQVFLRHTEPTRAVKVAVTACNVETGRLVVLDDEQAVDACVLSLWSSQGPGLKRRQGELLSDGSPFGVPVAVAAERFGGPVISVRTNNALFDMRSAPTGMALAKALVTASGHMLAGLPLLSVDIEPPALGGQWSDNHDIAMAWFAAGEAAGRAAVPKLLILDEKGEFPTGKPDNSLE